MIAAAQRHNFSTGRGGHSSRIVFYLFDVSVCVHAEDWCCQGEKASEVPCCYFLTGPQPFKNIITGGLLLAALVCSLFLSLFLGRDGIIYYDKECSPAVLQRFSDLSSRYAH